MKRAPAAHWDGPPRDAWRPWTPREAAARLRGVDVPWHVVGGWAVDLWLDRRTRRHGDLEIAVVREDFRAIRHALTGFALHAVGGGEARALAAGEAPASDRNQTWVLDRAAGVWRMDVMLEPGDAYTWVFRRDARIRAPRERMVGRRRGVPYLRPQGVLLFKAKADRDKDRADLEACLPGMDARARHWLAHALQLVHPGHPWIRRLEPEPRPG